MSSFTKFDSEVSVRFSKEASDKLGRDFWLVENTFIYYIGKIDSNEFVVVPRGFLSDGASVPFFIKGLIPAMGRHSQAAILHDYLTETYYKHKVIDSKVTEVPIDRKEIDLIFYEALDVLGVTFIKKSLIKFGVGFFRFFRRPVKPKKNYLKKELEEKFKNLLNGYETSTELLLGRCFYLIFLQ